VRGRNVIKKTFGITMVCIMVVAMYGVVLTPAGAATFVIGDTVEVITNLNVRTGPGTSYPEITDPDYPGYAPTGTTGIVLSGPSSADGYIWWEVDFGPGLYSGWSVEDGLDKVTPCPHSCWDRSPLSNDELANVVRSNFPLGAVTQTGESVRVTAYAVAKAESGGNPSACGDNDRSIGLWQINIDYHPQYDKCRLFEQDYNANAAKEISNSGKDWNPWCTWEKTACGGNGDESYKNYLVQARKHFYPKVTSVSVSQSSISLGEAVKIYYSVSDDVGLARVELWRTTDKNGSPDDSNWQEVKQVSVSGTTYSDYLTDTPTSPGIYWYGIHVADNSGAPEAWNDERNSRTGGLPGVFGPIEVEVIGPNSPPQLSNGYVDPASGTPSTNFYYYVTYFDPDGDSPSVRQVIIDGIAYTMSSYLYEDSWVIYRYGPKNLIAGGTHYYFFYFEDGKGGWARLPSGIDMYLGPTVSQQTYPPEVTTTGASSITTSSAALWGNLDSTGGLDCQVWFEYGTTASYGSSTTPLSISSAGPFGAIISSLSPDTTYHFRACASNSEGTRYGSNMTFTTTTGEVVTFPDPNLEAAIRDAIGKPEGDIYQSDLEGLTELHASVRGIADLTGLEYCTNLSRLHLYRNQISDISPLSGLTNLQRLWLDENEISDISPITGLTNIQVLFLGKNRISDISSLSNFTELWWLDLRDNKVDNLSSLSSLTSLIGLWIADNYVNDISPLASLHQLNQLYAESNEINDISPLVHVHSLRALNLAENKVDDFSALSGLIELQELWLNDNQITNISPLAALISLKELDISGNEISDISPISSLLNLEFLNLDDNMIIDISPVSSLIGLTGLSMQNNQISDVGALANLTELKILYLDGNQIAEINPISGLSSYERIPEWPRHAGAPWGWWWERDPICLSLSNNRISNISPLQENEGLGEGEGIDLRGNPLSEDSLNIYIPQLEERGVIVLYDIPKTIYVDDDLADYPDADFTKIQDAVNAAGAGDIIIVYPGTYTENVDVSKSVILKGEGMPVVDAAGNGSAVTVTADDCTVEGFKAINSGPGSGDQGIKIFRCNNNVIRNNIASNNSVGISLWVTANNTVIGNTVSDNYYGLALWGATDSTLRNNAMHDNRFNFEVQNEFANDIDTSNTVDGKPIYYLVGEEDRVIDSTTDAGYVGVVNSANITVKDLVLTNRGQGVLLASTQSSTITNVSGSGIELWKSNNNTIKDNNVPDTIVLIESSGNQLKNNNIHSNYSCAIRLMASSYNTLTGNNLDSNQHTGICFVGYPQGPGSNNNLLYFNDFVNNSKNASCYDGFNLSINTWNSPEEITYTYNGKTFTNFLGNYWSDYEDKYPGAEEIDSTGIWDPPYTIDGDNDNYPLVEPFENYEIGADSPWPMFQHDPQHTGRSPYIGPQTDNVKWTYDFPEYPDRVYDSRVVVGQEDIIYVGRRGDEGIYSIEPNGTLRWRFELPDVTAICVGPNGMVYAVSCIGLSAIDQDGNELWHYVLPHHLNGSEPVIFNDKLYLVAYCIFPSDYMHLALFNFYFDGTVSWIYDLFDGVLYENPDFLASPSGSYGGIGSVTNGVDVVISYDGTIYCVERFYNRDTLYAFNSDGSLKWTRTFTSSVGKPSVSANGTILFRVGSSSYGISPDAEDVWIYNIPHYCAGGSFPSPVIGLDGTSYWRIGYNPWGTALFILFTLDSEGNLIWETDPEPCGYGSFSNSVAIDTNGIFYQLASNGLEAIDQYGSEVWSHALYGFWASEADMALGSDGTLYAATNQRLYAFGADTTPPTVSNTSPEDGAVDVRIDIAITATFNDAMNSSTITTESFALAGSDVSGTITYDSDIYTATFTPYANLEYDHTYTATLSTDITDEAGNPLEEDYSWSFSTKTEWSFAIITDLHIGRGYPDYCGQGWIDPRSALDENGNLKQDYYLTQRLNKVVDEILDLRETQDIRFVAVLGDISDSGELSELETAKHILDRLNIVTDDNKGDLFYVPVLGNHDLWSCTDSIDPNQPLPQIFWLAFRDQFEWLKSHLGDNWEQSWDDTVLYPQYYNFSVNMRDVNLVFLDLNSRDPGVLGAGKGIGALSNDTENWLIDQLGFQGTPTVLLSHIPVSLDPTAFLLNPGAMAAISLHIADSETRVLGNFAGHKHGYYDYSKSFLPDAIGPLQNPIFMDANDELSSFPLSMPVVTTEAMMVGSNEPNAKGCIRIVKMDESFTPDDYAAIAGDGLLALNPYFKDIEWSPRVRPVLGWPVWEYYWKTEFELYPFTGVTPTSWELNPGHGSTLTSPDDIDIDYDDEPPYYDWVRVEHRYPREGGTYTVEYTVKSGVEEETITRTITIPYLNGFFSESPVDIVITDPDGLTTSKQASGIPGATYYETDLDDDGDLDDIIIFSDMKLGDYLITVVPEAGASPEDTYILGVTREDGTVLVLADGVPIENVPAQGYLVRSTGQEETPLLSFPLAHVNGPYLGDEGSPIAFDASGSNDPDGTIVSYQWDFGDGSTVPGTSTPTHAYGDNGVYTVTLTVTDDDGLTRVATASVTVHNVPPTVGTITAPLDPVPVNTLINTGGNFTDPGFLDTHTAEWDWGDTSTSPGTVTQTAEGGNVTGGHTYDTPGVYTVKLTVEDDDGGVGSAEYQYVVVYDGSAGFVTGGGWIDSPDGAYAPDPLLTGKANFGFVSRYKKGATVPTGQTEFQFKVADLNFRSDSYDWLVIAGHKAMYKGTGTINGQGNYGFMLSAIDEKLTPSTDVDMFRIKIWDKDDDDTIVYDNMMEAADDADPATEIGGGSIVIHKQK